MNFDEMFKKAEAEYTNTYSEKSDWFKFSEGDNRVRIMSWLEPLGSHYSKNPELYSGICIGKDHCTGCKEAEAETDDKKKNKVQVKFLTWILDYKDNTLKLAKFPYKVMTALQVFQGNPDYVFSEMPMPYDITINAKNAGKTDVIYTVMPTKERPLPADVLEKHAKNGTPAEIKEKMKAKKLKELGVIAEEPKKDLKAGEPDRGYDYPTDDINPENISF